MNVMQAQLAALYEVHDFFFSAAPGEKQVRQNWD